MAFEIKHHRIESEEPVYYVVHGQHLHLKLVKLQYDVRNFEGAACAGLDTELFFPTPTEATPSRMDMHRRMCVECPVMEACLEWGVVHEAHGIWGGTSASERNKIRRHAGLACNDLLYDTLAL